MASEFPFDPNALPPELKKFMAASAAPPGFAVNASGIVVPRALGQPAWMSHMASYLESRAYLQESPAQLVGMCLGYWPREEMLLALAVLNNAFLRGKTDAVRKLYRAQLTPEAGAKFDQAMAEPNRSFLARQPILAAMRVVLESPEPDKPAETLNPLITAIVLAHAVASTLESEFSKDEMLVEGVPAGIGIELVRNAAFNDPPDINTLVCAHGRVWRESARRLSRVTLRAAPADLVKEATGLEVEDFLALGFALYAFPSSWEKPGDPYHVNNLDELHSPEVVELFKEAVSFELDEYERGSVGGPWDFLDFEQRPVLVVGKKVIVLDPFFLLFRVTTGLYWYVHDHELRHHGESARDKWSQAYGEMIELDVLERMRGLAPRVLRGKTFFDENDFAAAYPGKKGKSPRKCDAGVDFGVELVLVEVQAKSLALETRVEGVLEKFKDDTERLVLRKAEQIDATARQFLANETALTGCAAVPGRVVVPVIVVGGGYPVTPSTLPYIKAKLQERGVLASGSVSELCILSPMELERLLALHRQGESAPNVLRSWQRSDRSQVPFQMYVDHRRDLRAKLDKDGDELGPPAILTEAMQRLAIKAE